MINKYKSLAYSEICFAYWHISSIKFCKTFSTIKYECSYAKWCVRLYILKIILIWDYNTLSGSNALIKKCVNSLSITLCFSRLGLRIVSKWKNDRQITVYSDGTR